ncbi:MAG: ABC transporter ATP-binding protein [Chloroflexota bacterium]
MQSVEARSPAKTSSDNAIVVANLVKQYGSLRAVDGLSFTVRRGEILALLGPNGAGKTTTVEILEGYRPADSGEVRVLGLNPADDGRQLRERIGLMLQQTGLYERIRVREAIELFCSYYQQPRRPDDLITLVGLEHQESTAFQNLSGGQKQWLSLALALAGNPELAFLDEPTASLDPQARLQTWEIIVGLRDAGVTVLLTTHNMEEAQRLADHVAIIDHGRLIAYGTPDDLTGVSSSEVVTFRAPEGLDLAGLLALPAGAEVRPEPTRLSPAMPSTPWRLWPSGVKSHKPRWRTCGWSAPPWKMCSCA